MAIHHWQASAAAISISGITLFTLTACQGAPSAPTSAPASSAARAQETAGTPGSPASPAANTPEAARAYARCLTDAGVAVMIVEGNRVVLAASDGQAGGATASNPTQAQQRCLQKVPAYHEPDFNER
jgi:CubicO group peptidase (beta-lactamase class C family)